ncbi:hypothetical protein WPS_25750 [Vulcanimicrobium alpinum]|uniref:SIMPL domain-containing protein n=2 Tax=Vulcanimicrobium alpinum TaxID=3016050 RepID=A0AAN1XYI2_UNVUL|nr:hypothetical protein WPS_25750 [Vulcanimicrobium alpinum]
MTMIVRLVVCACLIPLATSAQTPAAPPVRMAQIAPPMMPVMPVAHPPALAGGGIVVQGRGVARVAAKMLGFTAAARGPAQDDSVLAAMKAAGIDDAAVGIPGPQISLGPNQPTQLRGTIRNASPAKLASIARAASAYVQSHPGTAIDGVQFFARLDDCAMVEQTARAAALADARRKAQAIAASASVGLGSVAGVVETGGCASDGSPLDPSGRQYVDVDTLTARVSVVESVTFAIAAPDASQRRRAL